MLARLRLLLAWILMGAVPVQGFAAGSMLLCAAATHEVAAQAGAQLQHDRTTHTHDAGYVAKKSTGKAAVADAQHQCSLCAACCHSVGITQLASMGQASTAPQADLADPFVLIVSHAPPLPDKPPRG